MPNTQPKKYYFILSPDYNAENRLIAKAAEYYGSKDYENIDADTEFWNLLGKIVDATKGRSNGSMFLIGAATLAMARCNSVYVSKNWEDDDYCKFCHALAFAHGREIVYES